MEIMLLLVVNWMCDNYTDIMLVMPLLVTAFFIMVIRL